MKYSLGTIEILRAQAFFHCISKLESYIEGTLVKSLIHCKLENLKKLIESLLFAKKNAMITDQDFHISSGWSLYSWSKLTFVSN